MSSPRTFEIDHHSLRNVVEGNLQIAGYLFLARNGVRRDDCNTTVIWMLAREIHDEFLQKLDVEQFFQDLALLYRIYEFGHPEHLRFKLQAVTHAQRLGVTTPDEKDSKKWAQKMFDHERAHQKVAHEFGIDSKIKITKTTDSRSIPYLELNIKNFRAAVQDDPYRLAGIYGKLLMAPDKVGLGYEMETQMANRFLRLATLGASCK